MKNYREVAETVLERRDAYQKAKKHKRDIIIRTTAGGSVLYLAALLGFGAYRGSAMHPDSAGIPLSKSDVYYALSENGASEVYGSDSLPSAYNGTDGCDHLTDVEEGTGSPAEGSSLTAAPGNIASDAHRPISGQETASEGSGILPVSYSSLSLPQGQVRPEIISEYASSSQSVSDVLPFSEEMLTKSCAILEGQITDMYLKRYIYDTYNDKFGPKEIYHNQSSSVVYELAVDKVWYGDESLSGSTVLIEDDSYLIDPYFSLKVGCSYVIPVSDLDEKKWIWEEYAGGDLTRDGRYTTLYPHHPQIEVTEDGDYIVTTDWETLCLNSARDIQLDIPENSFVEYHPENPAGKDGLITTEWRTLLISAYDAVYYYDKLELVTADEFFIQLNQLLDKYLSQ